MVKLIQGTLVLFFVIYIWDFSAALWHLCEVVQQWVD